MAEIKAILFDMDGTLYDCPDLLEKQRIVAIEVLRDFFLWKKKYMMDVLRHTEKYLKNELGCKPSMSSVVVTAGVPLATYMYECGRRYDGSEFIQRDEELLSTLQTLQKKYKLVLVTNNNRKQTDLILDKLNITDYFSETFSLNETLIIKPDVKLYEYVLQQCHLKADECLVVGDRYDIDLAPAKKLGMEVLLVNTMQDVYNIEQYIHSLPANT